MSDEMLPEVAVPKTIADYEALPEGAPFQLINGEIVMNAAPHFFHQRIISRLSRKMGNFAEERDLGEVIVSPVDVYLLETEVYQPDIVFIAKERLSIVIDGKIKGVPDLTVEVLSPTTGYYDLSHKKLVYESTGVREFWILYPNEEIIEIFENVDGQFEQIARVKKLGKVASKVLSGFSVKLTDIF